MSLLPIILTVCAASYWADVPSPEIDNLSELERQILSCRRAIGSGEFKMAVRSLDAKDHNSDYDIWLNKDGQIRQERTVHGEVQVSIFSREYAYYYGGVPTRFSDPILTHRKTVNRLPVREARMDALPFLVCNPLVVMFAPSEFPFLPHVGLETWINSRRREDVRITSTTWNGLPATTVSFTEPAHGDVFEYDVVPSRSYNIVRWRFSSTAPNGGTPIILVYDQTCTLGEIAPGVWFPNHIEVKGDWGGQPKVHETTDITAFNVGENLPDEVFSLGWQGKLPAKQIVVLESQNRKANAVPTTRQAALYWDGKTVRRLTPKDDIERRQSAHQGELFVQTYYARMTAVVLGVGGALAIAVWILSPLIAQRRKATKGV